MSNTTAPERVIKTPPRPKRSDDYVRKAAVERILPEVIEWLEEEDWEETEEEREGVIKDLLEVIDISDGYAAAARLDDRGWYPSSSLVKILDELGSCLHNAEKAAVEAWVRGYVVRVPFEEQQAVWHGARSGVVEKVLPKEAQCLVKFADGKSSLVNAECLSDVQA